MYKALAPRPKCSWCQKATDVLLRAVAHVYRHNHSEANQIYFCTSIHGRLWKESLGRRFVRWERKPAN